MNSNEDLFETLVVIEFDSKCCQDVKNWLSNKLKTSKDKNGAELLTKYTANSKNEVKIALTISFFEINFYSKNKGSIFKYRSLLAKIA